MALLDGKQLADELEVEPVTVAQLSEQRYLVGAQERRCHQGGGLGYGTPATSSYMRGRESSISCFSTTQIRRMALELHQV